MARRYDSNGRCVIVKFDGFDGDNNRAAAYYGRVVEKSGESKDFKRLLIPLPPQSPMEWPIRPEGYDAAAQAALDCGRVLRKKP